MVFEEKVRAQMGGGVQMRVYYVHTLLSGDVNTVTADDLDLNWITAAVYSANVVTIVATDTFHAGTLSIDATGKQGLVLCTKDNDSGTIMAWGY